MPLVDAYGERKFMEVRQDTWGHLAPKIGRKYKGFILIATSPYSGLGWTVIQDEFEGMESNPWYYDHLCEYINNLDLEDGKLFRFTGTYSFTKPSNKKVGRDAYLDEYLGYFKGEIVEIDLPS